MSTGFSQQGFVLSLGLHLSVVAVVAMLAWTKPFERKQETIFELIPLGTPGGADEGELPEPQSKVPDGPRVQPAPEPVNVPPPPRPQPPRPAQPPPPRPQPAPPPSPKPAPTSKPVPAPSTKAEPAPKKPDRMSYEDFVQQHGKPKPRTTAPKPSTPARAQTAPRIDTKFTSTVSGANRIAGSLSGSADADRTEVTLYLARLFDAIERAWEKPSGLELTVAVDIDVAPNGRISNVRIAKSSGNTAYDESALAAVRAVGTGGPTPGGQTLLRTLRFNMKPQ